MVNVCVCVHMFISVHARVCEIVCMHVCVYAHTCISRGEEGEVHACVYMTKCQKVCKESGQKGLNFFKLM